MADIALAGVFSHNYVLSKKPPAGVGQMAWMSWLCMSVPTPALSGSGSGVGDEDGHPLSRTSPAPPSYVLFYFYCDYTSILQSILPRRLEVSQRHEENLIFFLRAFASL